MAELLVRVQDKVNADLDLDLQCTKRGDVIAACPDGWPWSEAERTAPYWRIFKIPALPLDEALTLTTPELPADPLNPGRLRKRAQYLDVDAILASALPQAIKDYLNDDTRAQQTFTVTAPLSTVRAWRKLKAVLSVA